MRHADFIEGDSHDPSSRRRRYAGSAGRDRSRPRWPNENVTSNAAAPASNKSNNRLMIINGNSGRVIYDDGRDDMFWVTVTSSDGITTAGASIAARWDAVDQAA
jgi:hypothetical protein